jgi:hypothetical protein
MSFEIVLGDSFGQDQMPRLFAHARQRVPQIKSNVYQMFTKKAKKRSNILV